MVKKSQLEATVREVTERCGEFLERWKIAPHTLDMEECCHLFMEEMERGLATKEGSSLAMIPTYTKADNLITPGEKVIVLDAGGTNFRTCLISFDQNMEVKIEG